MKKKYFGTDGVRGLVNQYPIRTDFFLKLSYSLGLYLIKKQKNKRLSVLIGKDTRESGPMIQSTLISGFSSIGIDCTIIGSAPTPVVSFMTRELNCDLGIMISASHNPYFDNGVKIFKSDGSKLSDEEELEVECIIEEELNPNYAQSSKIGVVKQHDSNFYEYKKKIKQIIPKKVNFKNLKVIVDCAHGAAYKIAPEILKEHGVDLITLSDRPNGKNINLNCGALHIEKLRKLVVNTKADVGFAYDGDADRLMVVDDSGEIIDGDKILAIISSNLVKQGKLKGGGVVVTKMSNYGLHQYLNKKSLKIYQCKVGDRYVTEEMKKRNCNLGGEQSGHIIFSDISNTGDSIMSTLLILSILKKEKKKLSKFLLDFKKFPQTLINLRLKRKPEEILKNNEIQCLITKLSDELSDKGSILVRKSGTENLLRIMVQSELSDLNKNIINKLTYSIKKIDKN